MKLEKNYTLTKIIHFLFVQLMYIVQCTQISRSGTKPVCQSKCTNILHRHLFSIFSILWKITLSYNYEPLLFVTTNDQFKHTGYSNLLARFASHDRPPPPLYRLELYQELIYTCNLLFLQCWMSMLYV